MVGATSSSLVCGGGVKPARSASAVAVERGGRIANCEKALVG